MKQGKRITVLLQSDGVKISLRDIIMLIIYKYRDTMVFLRTYMHIYVVLQYPMQPTFNSSVLTLPVKFLPYVIYTYCTYLCV